MRTVKGNVEAKQAKLIKTEGLTKHVVRRGHPKYNNRENTSATTTRGASTASRSSRISKGAGEEQEVLPSWGKAGAG